MFKVNFAERRIKMGNVPLDLKYSKEHEWIRLDGNKVYIGITDYAQEALGDIVFVELPEQDSEIEAGEIAGVIESVKAASDMYSPLSGKVIEVNKELEDAPENINEEPYEYWVFGLELADISELDELMDTEGYEKFCAEEV